MRRRRDISQFSPSGFLDSAEERIATPEQKFRSDFFYYYLIDISQNSLEERFESILALTSNFAFLFDLSKPVSLQQCENLSTKLTSGTSQDIDASSLFSEIQFIASICQSDCSLVENNQPITVLNYLAKNDLLTNVLNLVIALRILSTLPVGVATVEASFSKPKLIKSYLRSTMLNDRSSGFAIMPIEISLLSKVEMDAIIDKFAAMKTRRIDLNNT